MIILAYRRIVQYNWARKWLCEMYGRKKTVSFVHTVFYAIERLKLLMRRNNGARRTRQGQRPCRINRPHLGIYQLLQKALFLIHYGGFTRHFGERALFNH